MRITVNGDPREVRDAPTLLDLLKQLDLDPRTVVVEHNRHIVRRPRLDQVSLHDGDAIEVVHFVGGG